MSAAGVVDLPVNVLGAAHAATGPVFAHIVALTIVFAGRAIATVDPAQYRGEQAVTGG